MVAPKRRSKRGDARPARAGTRRYRHPVFGASSDVLKKASQEAQSELARFKAVSGLEDNLAYDKPELLVRLTPKGEALGFSTARVAKALRAAHMR